MKRWSLGVVVGLLLVGQLAASATTTGVPLGPNKLATSLYGNPYTGSKINPTPRRTIGALKTARDAGVRVIVDFAGSQSNYRNADGSFSLANWKLEVDRYRGVNIAPFIADGTIVAHEIVAEAKTRSQWGGTVITNDVLDEMARYSKAIWPDMATVVRVDPLDLEEDAAGYRQPWPGFVWQYLDGAEPRYSADKGDAVAFASAEQAAADRQGLSVVPGLNVLAGGDGSSGIPSPTKSGAWAMSAAEVRNYATAMLVNTSACAFELFKYHATYFARTDIAAAMADVVALANTRPPLPCRRR